MNEYISEINESNINKCVVISGWIKTARCQKRISFINMNDGSSINGIQIIVSNDITDYEKILPYLSTGTSIKITTSGAGDIDSASYYLQCGNASGSYNLCNSSLGAGERSCDFIGPWTDDNAHTIYCMLNDTTNISSEVNTSFTADNTAPNATTIDNLEGDTIAKYWDTDDDSNTTAQLNLPESNMKCRWDIFDANYTNMNSSYECVIAGTLASCNFNPAVSSQTNETIRYVACQDQYGNDQNSTQNTDIIFGVDWTIPDVTNTNDGAIHLPGYNVTLTMKDMPAGTVVTVYYCNDTLGTCNPYIQWTGTNGTQKVISFDQRGTWYLRWNATDEAGNLNFTNQTKQTIVFINTLPLISGQIYSNITPHKFIVNASVYDAVGSSQSPSFNCWLYHRTGAGAYSNKSMQMIDGSITNGIYSANISTSDGYSVFDSIDTYVNCSDGMEWNTSTTDSNTIPNFKPSAPVIDVIPDAPAVDDDLYCNITVNSTDPDNDAITYNYEWYKNGANQNINNNLLKAANTTKGEEWNCTVIPYDGYENGTAGSDKVTVGNSAPVFNTSKPILNISWPEDTINDTLNLSHHFYDIDGDALTYYYTPISNINIQINHTTGIVIFTSDANFTGIRYLQFNATDGVLWSNYSNNVTLNITNVNDAPYFDPALINLTAYENVTFVYDINATDIDPTSDVLNFTSNSTLFTINSSTGLIQFTPNSSHVGTYDINFTVCDNHDVCDYDVITLEVLNFVNNIRFNVKDRLIQTPLDNITVTGGTTCAAGCNFNYSLTIVELNGPATYTFTKPGFSSNLTILNIAGDITVDIYLDDTESPEIDLVNITPRLGNSNTSFFIDIIISAADNLNLSEARFSYTLSQGFSETSTINLNKIDNNTFNGSIGPYAAERFLMSSSIFINDSYGNNVSQTNDDIWFMFVVGGNVSFVYDKSTTIELTKGWNLFSIPSSVSNTSIMSILDQLGNGNWGCGHDDALPYDCNASDGDFVGNWTSIWSYNKTDGSWLVFDPTDYYPTIPDGQEFQTLEFYKGYWINMTEAENLTINYRG